MMCGSKLKRVGSRTALMRVLVFLSVLVTAGPALARTAEPPAVKVLTVDEAVALAVRNSPSPTCVK